MGRFLRGTWERRERRYYRVSARRGARGRPALATVTRGRMAAYRGGTLAYRRDARSYPGTPARKRLTRPLSESMGAEQVLPWQT
jgi:hypothetical protein